MPCMQALKLARDQVTACEQALKAAERQLGELETSIPKARMEAEAETAKAQDIQKSLAELRANTEVGMHAALILSIFFL
jgi:chromosome segregation ATPase